MSVDAFSWFHVHSLLRRLATSTRSTALSNHRQPIIGLLNIKQPLWKLRRTPGLPLYIPTHAHSRAWQINLEFTLVAFGGRWEAVSRATKSDRVTLCLGELVIISVYKTRCRIDAEFVKPEKNLRVKISKRVTLHLNYRIKYGLRFKRYSNFHLVFFRLGIVNRVEWLWNPSDSLVICFRGLDDAKDSIAFITFWSYWPTKASHYFIPSQFVIINNNNKGLCNCVYLVS